MKILELTLNAIQSADLQQFYLGILALPETRLGTELDFAVQVGHTRLVFHAAQPGWHGRYHFAFDVPRDRFDAALRWLAERTGPIASLKGETVFHSNSWNADMQYFMDPQGNILELVARHEKDPGRPPVDSNQPFHARELLSVSEIGICADSVTGAVAQLQTRIPGLPVFSGEGSDDFTAVGDEDGLLIVVRRQRIWFPETSVLADFLPLEVVLEHHHGQRYHLSAPPYPFTVQPLV